MFRVLMLSLLPAVAVVSGEADSAIVPPGFDHFYNLEYDEALKAFETAAQAEPSNPNLYNNIAQTVLFREMWRAGALESEMVSGGNSFLRRAKMKTPPDVAKRFDEAIGKAMSLSQARLDKNKDDIGALYAMGVAYGLRANYSFLVKKAWTDALRDATAGRKLHNRITEIDQRNMDARLMQGLHDYIVGSLPWHVKMVGFLAGIRGDREKGMEALQLVAEKGHFNRYDAKVLLAVLYRRERNAREAIPLLQAMVDRFPRNYLFRLELAQMFADAGRKSDALGALQRVEDLKLAGAPGFARLPMEKIYYYRGNVLFWERDWQLALDSLQRVTPKVGELDLNTGVMTWMRMGQIYDMQGKRPEAKQAYQHAIEVAPESEAAKESRGYLSSPYKRT